MDLINVAYLITSILSITFYISSIQFKKKKDILVFQNLSYACYTIVYLIKQAWSGAFITALTIVKNIVIIKLEGKKKKVPLGILITFIVLLIAISVAFYSGPASLIPLICDFSLFIATYLKNPKYIRYVVAVCGFMWGVFNYTSSAYILIVGNCLEIFSAVVAIVRFTKVEKKRKKRRKNRKSN